LEAALSYLDIRDLDDLDRAETNLLNLALSLVHAALAAERLKSDEEFHAAGRRAMHVTRTDAEWPRTA
jgi:hypothetical protein